MAFDSILYSVHAWSTKTINSSHSLGNSELQAGLTGGQISPSPETQPLLVTSSIPLNRKHTPLPTHFTHYKLAVLLWCQHQFYLERPLIKQQVRLLDHKFGKTVALASWRTYAWTSFWTRTFTLQDIHSRCPYSNNYSAAVKLDFNHKISSVQKAVVLWHFNVSLYSVRSINSKSHPNIKEQVFYHLLRDTPPPLPQVTASSPRVCADWICTLC